MPTPPKPDVLRFAAEQDEIDSANKATAAALAKAKADHKPREWGKVAGKGKELTYAQKEHRKRQLGQSGGQTGGKNYIEEEKRILRQAGGGGMGFD